MMWIRCLIFICTPIVLQGMSLQFLLIDTIQTHKKIASQAGQDILTALTIEQTSDLKHLVSLFLHWKDDFYGANPLLRAIKKIDNCSGGSVWKKQLFIEILSYAVTEIEQNQDLVSCVNTKWVNAYECGGDKFKCYGTPFMQNAPPILSAILNKIICDQERLTWSDNDIKLLNKYKQYENGHDKSFEYNRNHNGMVEMTTVPNMLRTYNDNCYFWKNILESNGPDLTATSGILQRQYYYVPATQ